MKHVLAILFLLLLAIPSYAQHGNGEVAGIYPGFSLAFHGASADDIAMTSIVGRSERNKGEIFGVVFRTASASMQVMEILDDKGGLVKGITLGDLLGKSADGTVTMLGADAIAGDRYVRHMYDITLRKGRNVRLIVRALSTGDPNNPDAPHPLLVTYAIEGAETEKLVLRLRLPVEGTAEATPNGFMVAAKKSPAAFSAAILPAPRQVEIAGSAVLVTSQPVALDGDGHQTPMLWMQIDGAGGSSPSAARDQALASLRAAESMAGGPNIVVVSATDKANINPNDTVSMTLIYVNIGTQSASGVTLKNPVPEGMRYLMASARGEGMDVAYDRLLVADGGAGEISAVRWTMNGELKPGEERVASFKTIVQ